MHPAGYPTVVAVENMGKKLEAATNGRIKFQMFPGSVLGDEKAMIEQTQVGAINVLRTSLGRVARDVARKITGTTGEARATSPTLRDRIAQLRRQRLPRCATASPS